MPSGRIEVTPGLVVLDKPPGLTSHACVARVRRLAGTKKVGHAGTLDPMATGVLVLGVGRATRFLTYLVGLDKEYSATIRLGQSTTTDDAEGETVAEAAANRLTAAQVEAALQPLRGAIQQVPSSVSAVKVDGRRAYARVRDGEAVVLKPRSVVIDRFEVLASRLEGERLDLDVMVRCSSGTYVRALARDLGAALGVGGHLTALRRLTVGPFRVEDAASLEDLEERFAVQPLGAAAAALFPVRRLDADEARAVAYGQRIPGGEDESGGPVAGIGPEGDLVAMLRPAPGSAQLRPEAVFV
ncbi:MAG: tRNA pseudouridine(55) synthase TruB [Bifidobacteriaceae bacterium]|nr:tRNA pseudouridine(55) synthase TruB [Bifidobacteriaceae bacterium]